MNLTSTPMTNKNESTPTTRDIDISVELDASPEDVFRAVANGTELAKWHVPNARVTPPTDGKKASIWLSWGEGMSVEKEVEIWDEPKRLRYPAGRNSETKAQLWADWSIEAREGGKTTLRLVHSGFSANADWDDEYESHARGWRLMLQNLRHYFSRHAKKAAVHLPFTKKIDALRPATWSALLSKLGLEGVPAAGQPFRITRPDGQVITGKFDLVNPARDLALVVHELDDALLRFSLEGGAKAPGTFLYGYVIAFGEEQAPRAQALAATMKSFIDTIA
jgi:uncharacterized protein YndB with AHSA1/START domain